MAITKVINDLIDLNATDATKSLKMPSGAAYSGTAQDGMVRNDTDGDSQGSASTMQHYNGTEWKNFENLSNGFTANFLVVGGGGGGGDSALGNNGAGGAGGYKTTTTYSGSETPLTASLGTAYTVEVGPGGAINLNGTESKFGVVSSEIISSGGGKGGIAISPCDGGNGASGGGGAALNPTPAGSGGTATPSGQGNNGGAAYGSPSFSGGGGGGADAVGGSANSAGPGNGGAGTSNNITGTNTPYAGGGGGGSGDGFTSGQGTGGLGGGGIGVEYDTQRIATNGALNTGGGGGGGIFRQGIYSAKSGGSGIVILRYPTASVASYQLDASSGLDTTTDTAYPIANTAYYKLNDDALDSAGSINGTWSGTETYAAGRFGQAANFNGTSAISLGALNQFSSTTVSFSLWFYSTSVSNTAILLGSNKNAIFAGEFDLYTYNSGFLVTVATSASAYRQLTTPANLSNNTWHNVVVTLNTSDANVAKIYLDGNEQTTTVIGSVGNITTALLNSTENLNIGVDNVPSSYFNGSIDQVRIFPTVLSAGNVTSLYNESTVNESTDGTDSILQFIGGTGTVTFS